MRRPSQKTIDIYNQLVEKQNEVRRQLIRIHKKQEETSGAGRLPALIIPKKARKISANRFQGVDRNAIRMRVKAFWRAYGEAKDLFGKGLTSYLARTVKDGYMELWRDQIDFMGGGRPEGVASRFTKAQIEDSYLGEFMATYNRLVSLSPEVFLALLYKGEIIAFKYIYQDMVNGTGQKENSWLEQQNQALDVYRSAKARMNLMEVTSKIIGEKPVNHKNKTIRKAEKRQREDEELEEARKKREERKKEAKK